MKNQSHPASVKICQNFNWSTGLKKLRGNKEDYFNNTFSLKWSGYRSYVNGKKINYIFPNSGQIVKIAVKYSFSGKRVNLTTAIAIM